MHKPHVPVVTRTAAQYATSNVLSGQSVGNRVLQKQNTRLPTFLPSKALEVAYREPRQARRAWARHVDAGSPRIFFVTPRAGDAEGVVHATRPLAVQGVLIEDFWLRFEGGRVVELHAEKNEDALRTLVGMDEGAAMLGECALVPYESPIRESGILLYNTLFDENAACHLALGRGYSSNIRDYEKYSLDELRAMGVNDSMVHEDFMIGSAELDITGLTASGERLPIFRSGGWAF